MGLKNAACGIVLEAMSDETFAIKAFESPKVSRKKVVQNSVPTKKDVEKLMKTVQPNMHLMHLQRGLIYLLLKHIISFMDFEFMGGSMGRAVGSAIVKGAQTAIHQKKSFILFTCSGGARMQEGIISLMQMPRTVAAVELLNKNKIPYIVILTDPTTGGVTASFAMLGDITLAETGSTIGFAGKRVILDTIREELPVNFQKAEYLKEHGPVSRTEIVNEWVSTDTYQSSHSYRLLKEAIERDLVSEGDYGKLHINKNE